MYIYIYLIGVMLPEREVGVDGCVGVGVLVVSGLVPPASVELGGRLY